MLEDFYWNYDSIGSEEFKIASGDYDCVLNEGDYIQVRAISDSTDDIRVSNSFPSNITFEYV